MKIESKLIYKNLLRLQFSLYSRIYALYKLIMVCIYQNRSFQVFINHSLMVNTPALSGRFLCLYDRCGFSNQSFIFGISCQFPQRKIHKLLVAKICY